MYKIADKKITYMNLLPLIQNPICVETGEPHAYIGKIL